MSLEEADDRLLARSTAEGAAFLRAVGNQLSDPELRGPDDLAAQMIAPGFNAAALVRIPLLRRLALRIIEGILPGGIWFELARTGGMDDYLRDRIAGDTKQVVMLGAGLDTRGYRMPELAGVTLYEVDHPVTASYKAERVAAVIGKPPSNIRYVTIDFARQDLGQIMRDAGHDPSANTAVIWSGVAPYLEPEAVDSTLAWVASLAPGSTLVFDFLWAELLDSQAPERELFGAKQLLQRTEAQGEPLRSGIPRGRTREFLAERGLELVEELGPNEGTERYLTRSDGSVAGQLWEFGGIAVAKVPAPAQ